jgi:hypothetical protein
MRRPIDIDSEILDNEGLMYDHEKASSEGLFEELTLKMSDGEGDERQIPVSNELFEALCRVLDLGVNVLPGTKQAFPITLEYVYDFGRAEQLA